MLGDKARYRKCSNSNYYALKKNLHAKKEYIMM